MENVKLKKRLPLTFGLLALGIIIISTISSFLIRGLSNQIAQYQQTEQKKIVLLNSIDRNFAKIEKEFYRGIGAIDANIKQQSKGQIKEITDLVQKEIKELEEIESENSQDITKIKEMSKRVGQAFEQLLQMPVQSVQDIENFWNFEKNQVDAPLKEFSQFLSQLVQERELQANQKMELLQNQAMLGRVIIPILGLIILILAVVLAIRLAKSIVLPLQQMERAAAKLAQGQLDVEIDYSSKNECGNLAQSMRDMSANLKQYIASIDARMQDFSVGNLNSQSDVVYQGDFVSIDESINRAAVAVGEVMKRIRHASEQVANGSDQVSSGASAVSEGATQQASAVEQLAATINEISIQVKENAQNATSANIQVDQVSTEMQASNKKMQEMIHAMREISTSSQEISKIIKTIEDIAFQTNILALNAAVEAARAGTAGKGFAVVADEVRNLASKSAQASKSTAALIEQSMRAVENGMTIADDTANALSMTVQGANEISEMIAKITQASNDQASAVSQITIGIEQISEVVQTSSATAQQSAAASEELLGQASSLQNIIKAFSTTQENDVESMVQKSDIAQDMLMPYNETYVGRDKY